MRITGGKYRSRNIKCPKGVIRPAMDRMRESIFSIMGNISEQSFLDLFSGSGLVGIEAASRGASPVVLVEKDFIKKDVILENISFVEEDITLKMMPVERYLKAAGRKFDIIYLDPPFPMKSKEKLIEMISKEKILEDEGIVLIHHPSEEKWPDHILDLEIFDRRVYGRSIVLFFRKMPINNSETQA